MIGNYGAGPNPANSYINPVPTTIDQLVQATGPASLVRNDGSLVYPPGAPQGGQQQQQFQAPIQGTPWWEQNPDSGVPSGIYDETGAAYVEEAPGVPIWQWAILLAVVGGGGYFAWTKFGKKGKKK